MWKEEKGGLGWRVRGNSAAEGPENREQGSRRQSALKKGWVGASYLKGKRSQAAERQQMRKEEVEEASLPFKEEIDGANQANHQKARRRFRSLPDSSVVVSSATVCFAR